MGSIFEVAWQLRGLERFLMELAIDPAIPCYIMDRLTEVLVENTRRVLELAGARIDIVYFYDDVATQTSLMLSSKMWREFIRPRHAQLIEVAHRYGKLRVYRVIAPLTAAVMNIYTFMPDKFVWWDPVKQAEAPPPQSAEERFNALPQQQPVHRRKQHRKHRSSALRGNRAEISTARPVGSNELKSLGFVP